MFRMARLPAVASYAKRLEQKLGCGPAIEGLMSGYNSYAATKGSNTSTAYGRLRSIRQFLQERQNHSINLYSPMKPGKTSSCLELSLATVFMADRFGIGTQIVFKCVIPTAPVHYAVSLEDGSTLEVTGVKKMAGSVPLFQVRLSQLSAFLHVNTIGRFAKFINFSHYQRKLLSLTENRIELG